MVLAVFRNSSRFRRTAKIAARWCVCALPSCKLAISRRFRVFKTRRNSLMPTPAFADIDTWRVVAVVWREVRCCLETKTLNYSIGVLMNAFDTFSKAFSEAASKAVSLSRFPFAIPFWRFPFARSMELHSENKLISFVFSSFQNGMIKHQLINNRLWWKFLILSRILSPTGNDSPGIAPRTKFWSGCHNAIGSHHNVCDASSWCSTWWKPIRWISSSHRNA